ncbi:hypothetical protein BJ165DRAFT_1512333 [Panaeolus papilionaceus]|nr:hypothetical protein BJ165DRAFT_1512333 [Panaeolus papilionaceus]
MPASTSPYPSPTTTNASAAYPFNSPRLLPPSHLPIPPLPVTKHVFSKSWGTLITPSTPPSRPTRHPRRRPSPALRSRHRGTGSCPVPEHGGTVFEYSRTGEDRVFSGERVCSRREGSVGLRIPHVMTYVAIFSFLPFLFPSSSPSPSPLLSPSLNLSIA